LRPPPRSPLFPYTTLFRSDEAPRIATVLAVPLLVLAPLAHSAQSRLLWQAAFSVAAIVLMRSIGYALLRRSRRRGMREATLVAGDRKSTRLNSSHVAISYA